MWSIFGAKIESLPISSVCQFFWAIHHLRDFFLSFDQSIIITSQLNFIKRINSAPFCLIHNIDCLIPLDWMLDWVSCI